MLHDITEYCPTFYQFPLQFNPGSNNSKNRISFRIKDDVSKDPFKTSQEHSDWNTIK